LHFGNASTALVAWLRARSENGRFYLRIEDTDPQRSKPEFAAAAQEDLRWMGLDWDGPVEFQSMRTEGYQAALERLNQKGLVFACRCTRKDLQAAVDGAVRAPHGAEDVGPHYPGTCAPLGLPLNGPYTVRAQGDGFPVRRADGAWAYTLAVVVDDAAQGITEVVRGSDLESATPQQEQLFAALDCVPPKYLHAPLWMGPDGQRLSKRHGAVSLRDWRASGRTAEELVGRLAWGLGLLEEPIPVRPVDLLKDFAWDRLRKTPVPASDYLPLAP
jgi:glutamyl-tRNA synthetase